MVTRIYRVSQERRIENSGATVHLRNSPSSHQTSPTANVVVAPAKAPANVVVRPARCRSNCTCVWRKAQEPDNHCANKRFAITTTSVDAIEVAAFGKKYRPSTVHIGL